MEKILRSPTPKLEYVITAIEKLTDMSAITSENYWVLYKRMNGKQNRMKW